MPKLNRLVELTVRGRPADRLGGLTSDNPIASFRLLRVLGSPTILYGEAYVLAVDAQNVGVAGAVSGTWVAGSTVTWEGGPSILFNRDVSWSSWFVSLKTGRSGVTDYTRTSGLNPRVTTPPWFLNNPFAMTPVLGTLNVGARTSVGGVELIVSGVRYTRPDSGGVVDNEFQAWARVERVGYETTDVVVGSEQHTNVTELTTWLLRRDARVATGATIQAGADVYSVVGVQPDPRRNDAYMRIRAVRALYSQART